MDQAEIRRFWDARAREDPYYFVDTRQRYRAPDQAHFWDAEPLLDYVLDGLGVALAPSDTALEIGCGIGRLTRVLATRVRQVIALDVSPEMLARGRELNSQLQNVSWWLGDGVSLAGVATQSIDACISMVVFQHVPDPGVTLGYVREVGRVLGPGGWAALQVSNDPRVHRRRIAGGWRIRAWLGLGPRGQSHPAWLGSAVDLAELEAAADEAGLAVERVVGEGTQYCQVLLRKRP